MARDILDEESQIPEVAPPPQLGIPARKSIGELRADAADRMAASGLGNQPGGPGEPDQSPLDDLLQKAAQVGRPAPKEHIWSGAGKALASGAAELGAQVAGAGEYVANRAFGPNDINASALHAVRTTAQQSAEDWRSEMTPQEQDELSRQWTSLDPHQTIWQGGPQEFIHSVMLHATSAAPAGAAFVLPMARLVRAGMVNGALTYVGATQAGLSMGQIANNISDDVIHADEGKLRSASPAYAQMIAQGMDPQQARTQLAQDAAKYAPVVGGLVAGAISTLAGRFITPVLSKE